MRLRGISLLIPFLLVSCTAAASPPSAADLLLTNGRVYTLDWAEPDAQAIAVRDGEIVFVESSLEAEAFRGPELCEEWLIKGPDTDTE